VKHNVASLGHLHMHADDDFVLAVQPTGNQVDCSAGI